MSSDQVPASHAKAGTMSSGAGRPGDPPGTAPAGAPRAGFALLLTLSMAQFMVVLDFTIVNVALPSIQNGLHVATTTLQWLVSGYAVAFGGFLLLGGRLADTYGRARLYRIGLVAFVVASMAGGLAVEPGLLIASRVVQGIGAAMLAPAGLSLLVTSWSDQKERSHALGIYGAIASAGFASGAVLGGLLVEVTWRLVFFVNVPVGVARGRGDQRRLGDPQRVARPGDGEHEQGYPGGHEYGARNVQLSPAAGRVRWQQPEGGDHQPAPGTVAGVRPGDRGADRAGRAAPGTAPASRRRVHRDRCCCRTLSTAPGACSRVMAGSPAAALAWMPRRQRSCHHKVVPTMPIPSACRFGCS